MSSDGTSAPGASDMQLDLMTESDMQKVGILSPLRESGMGGCVVKGSGTEEMRTLEVLDLKREF